VSERSVGRRVRRRYFARFGCVARFARAGGSCRIGVETLLRMLSEADIDCALVNSGGGRDRVRDKG